MSKVIPRLCIFFIGIPLVLFVVFFPYWYHLPLHLFICVICGLAAYELYTLFLARTPLIARPLVIGGAVFLPFIAALYKVLPALFKNLAFPFGNEIITYTFIVVLLLMLLVEVVTAKEFSHSLTRISASVFIVLYTGYLLTFVSRMVESSKEGAFKSSCLIAVFLLMVFLCDSFAWLFGVLLGKNNRGIIAASPNKSVVGFIGGFVGSICAGILSYFLWTDFFYGSIFKLIAIGMCIALASIVGDLVESIYKRSSGVKDSGHIIPGRGGVLDSVDSIIMAAPVFYLLLSLLYPSLL